MTVTLTLATFETPIGRMLIVTDEDGAVRALDWTDFEARMHRLLRLHHARGGGAREGGVTLVSGPLPTGVAACLERYFEGDLRALDGLHVRTGGTAFQRSVWAALREIPAGEVRSYADLARAIGRPTAVRAVGAANGANPVGVIVPCHRVVGTGGSLTGYAGGLERKRWLLQHERAALPHLART